MRAYAIPAEGEPGYMEIPDDGNEELLTLQTYVGGWIQAIPVPGDDEGKLTAYINEEGKIKGLPRNNLATEKFQSVLMPGDFIVGNLVILGVDMNTGESTPVPDGYEL